MRTDPRRHCRGPSKDRFRAARQAKARAERKTRGGQLVFPWFAPPAVKDPASDQTGRAAK